MIDRMGDLDPWMDETFIKKLWLSYGENVIVKLIRDKRTRYTMLNIKMITKLKIIKIV
jgi:hypothetical protein